MRQPPRCWTDSSIYPTPLRKTSEGWNSTSATSKNRRIGSALDSNRERKLHESIRTDGAEHRALLASVANPSHPNPLGNLTCDRRRSLVQSRESLSAYN